MESKIMESFRKRYQGKKVLVVGLGLQAGGVGIARFFAQLGAKVTVTDKKSEKILAESVAKLKGLDITFHLGGHILSDFQDADIVFKGPSVPWDMKELIETQNRGIPVEMELSFVASNFPGKIIGITGTRGKSTTTYLVFNLLKLSGLPVLLGGGLPGISTIDYLKTATENDYLVAELSSWALSGFHKKKISPHIAVLTNIYPDHLNYYKNIEDYAYDKQAIFMYQKTGDYFIANESVRKYTMSTRPIFFSKSDFPFRLNYLKGDHNLENAAAALQVAKILKIDEKKAVSIIANFKGLPFRQEIRGEKNNVIFINDTTSTTPIAAIKAISSFQDSPIYLILGGNSKNLPFDELLTKLENVKKIILLAGSFTDEILPKLKEKYQSKLIGPYNDLEKAIAEAYKIASNEKNKCYLLFSPGATSFAMFNNEFHRGREFNRIVESIINNV